MRNSGCAERSDNLYKESKHIYVDLGLRTKILLVAHQLKIIKIPRQNFTH